MPPCPPVCLKPDDSYSLSIREVTYQPGQRQRLHSHEETSITLVYRGSLQERVGKAQIWAGPLSVVVKPAGTPHSNRFGPQGASTIQLNLASKKGDDGGLGSSAGLEEWRWIHGGKVARRFLTVLVELRQGCGSPATENASIDLIAALEGDHPQACCGPPPAWLRRVKQQIEQTFAEGIRVRQLARQAGVHPVSLARCFRRHFGTSVTEHLRHLRVEEAARLLSSRGLAIVEVAMRCGYADQSHLCREFKSQTGLTPGLYRRLAG